MQVCARISGIAAAIAGGFLERIIAAGASAAIGIAVLPGPARADPPSTGHIVYRCETAGVTTFSDRPCGPDARTYEADTAGFSTYKPVPLTAGKSTQTRRKRQSKRRAAAAASAARARARHDADCEKIERALRDIRSRMRAGYSAQEGERLRVRHARLKERRRADHCR